MISRRAVLASAAAAAACGREGMRGFVSAETGKLMLGGAPYRFVGANVWYGAYLGAPSGDRERLRRELDRLAQIGVTNLRVLGASELSPLRSSLRPAFRDRAPPY